MVPLKKRLRNNFWIYFLVLVHSGLALPPKPHSDRNLIHTPIIIIRVVKTHLDGQSNGTVGGIYKWRYARFWEIFEASSWLLLFNSSFTMGTSNRLFSFLFLHKHVWKVGTCVYDIPSQKKEMLVEEGCCWVLGLLWESL